jgi:hypothetical protein
MQQVKLPAQCDDDVAAVFAGAQVHPEHKSAFLHRSKARSRPSG